MMFKILIALFGLVAVLQAKSYENYKVYSVVPTSEAQVQILVDLQKSGYDFWSDGFSVGKDVRIIVKPDQVEEFLHYSKSVGFDAVLRISNIEDLIKAQRRPARNVQRNSLGSFDWDNYHTLEEIHDWLDELERMYPNVVTNVTIGTSVEGRSIKGIIINFNPNSRGESPLIGMIEGGIHSREWISPATVTWIIREFLTSNDRDVRFLAEAFIWHIFPVVNPDGYEYTFTNDRMWRKNRNRDNFIACNNTDDDLSNGIDLNRNFDYLWMTVGASLNPCTQTYAGPSPGSERETQAISAHVNFLKGQGNFIYYFAFHSYSQMVLVPFSHVDGFDVLQADNYADMFEIAMRGADKLKSTHGTEYEVGTSLEILYAVSGSSFDWVKGVAEVPIVYLFELRDTEAFGFLLPSEEIVPNNEEIMECLLEMDRTTRALRYYSGAHTALGSIVSLTVSIGLLFLFK